MTHSVELKEVEVGGVMYWRTADGTHYPRVLDTNAVAALDSLLNRAERCYVSYGDVYGQYAFDLEYGLVRRTGGRVKAAMLVHPRSHGGSPISPGVVRIRVVGEEGDRWRHPYYVNPRLIWCEGLGDEYPIEIYVQHYRDISRRTYSPSQLVERFRSERAAKGWLSRHGVYLTVSRRGRPLDYLVSVPFAGEQEATTDQGMRRILDPRIVLPGFERPAICFDLGD